MKEINETVINTKIEEITAEAQKASNRIQKVLDKLVEVEERIRSILKQSGIKDSEVLEMFNYKSISIKYAGSRHGRFLHLTVNGRLLPNSVKDTGRSFFYHNDFNAEYDYMTVADIKHLVANLEGFLQNMKEKLVELQKIEVKDINI